jgi:hypothetical protein
VVSSAFFLTIVLVLFRSTGSWAQQNSPLYADVNKPIDARVEDLLSRMTLEEKIALAHADSKFSTAAFAAAVIYWSNPSSQNQVVS